MTESENRIIEQAKRLFFVGIGGISMSGLALVCRERGYTVAGSDRACSHLTKRLSAAGIPVLYEHKKENIIGYDAVVYTGAVGFDNPELAAALASGIPTVSRAALLGFMMRDYPCRIGVAGTHGKSTTTSMLAHILLSADRNPTVLSGAETDEMGGAYRIGGDEIFLFEACEYKDSFLQLLPNVSVILDIDVDHTDYFTGGLPAICESFRSYALLPFAREDALSLTVANADDDNVMKAVDGALRLATFGIQNEADYRAVKIRSENGHPSFDLLCGKERLGRVCLSVYGSHNIYNALAAAAVCDRLGLTAGEILSGLASFTGLRRRFEKKGDINGASVYIDYAHHPRELAATLDAARGMTKGRLIAFFEPHTYSRTAALWTEFTECFAAADLIYFLDIYAAREMPMENITSRRLARETKNAEYLPSYEDAVHRLLETVRPEDTVMILGAGTVDRIAQMLFDGK